MRKSVNEIKEECNLKMIELHGRTYKTKQIIELVRPLRKVIFYTKGQIEIILEKSLSEIREEKLKKLVV